MIELRGVTKTFPGMTAPAVRELDLQIPRGQIVMLVGPSGCGKTTTLKMINRLIEPTSGRIIIDGDDVTNVDPPSLRRKIGYVIQQIGLFPHRTIADNISTVPRLLEWEESRVTERVDELIDLVELEREMLTRYPDELSGGQRQRVGVARALAADPPVLLMDEPFGAVDPIVRANLQDELLDLQDRLHKTIVFVTHDIDEAIRIGDQVAILNVGGVLEQMGPPAEILRDPANRFVADFLGGERGLKRLGLIPVAQSVLTEGPVVRPTSSPDDVRRTMAEHGVDWSVVVDDSGRLLGWVDADALDGDWTTAINPYEVTLDPDASLREALDTVVTSHAQTAVVVEEGRYLGLVALDQISQEIIR